MRNRRERLARELAAALLLAFGVATPAWGQDLAPATEVAVDEAITTFMSTFQVPGLSLAVVRGGQLRLERGYGMADLENFVPVKAATTFPIASISKSLTAVAALQLAQRGQLDLDAPVQRYVPDFPEKDAPITSRHLLRHTSGIRHYEGDEYTNTRHYEGVSASLEAFAEDALLHAPGAAPTYTSHGYTLLGAVLEEASGLPFHDYLRRHVLEPAGMVATRVNDVRQLIPNRAEGYEVLPSGSVVNAQFVDPSNRIPGGGLLSTAGDMARFTVALMEGRLLDPESYEEMTAPTPMPEGPIPLGAGWALGTAKWLSDREPRPDAIWSGGNILGSTSVVFMLVGDGVSVSLLTNLQGKGTELLRLAYDLATLVAEGS